MIVRYRARQAAWHSSHARVCWSCKASCGFMLPTSFCCLLGLSPGWGIPAGRVWNVPAMSLYTLNSGSVWAHFLIQITNLLSYCEVSSFHVVSAAHRLCVFLIVFYEVGEVILFILWGVDVLRWMMYPRLFSTCQSCHGTPVLLFVFHHCVGLSVEAFFLL